MIKHIIPSTYASYDLFFNYGLENITQLSILDCILYNFDDSIFLRLENHHDRKTLMNLELRKRNIRISRPSNYVYNHKIRKFVRSLGGQLNRHIKYIYI